MRTRSRAIRRTVVAAVAVGVTACAPRAPGPPPPTSAPNALSEAPSEPAPATEPTTPDAGPPGAGASDAGVVAASTERPVDAGEPPRPAPPAECNPERWGGWEGTPQCRARARRQVPGAHRRCETDEDCVFVSRGCNPHVVHRRHAGRYRGWGAPCVGPGAGQCSGPDTAICVQGCCFQDDRLWLDP